MSKMIVGNWKMNGSVKLADEFIAGLDKHVILGLPSIFIAYAHLKNPEMQIAAQDCSVFSDFGAHTGEVSAKMLADAGCKYVILGHSERRKHANFDTIDNVLLKLQNVIQNKMTAILCVDENYMKLLDKNTSDFIQNHVNEIVIAYEPISAIGTGIIPSSGNISQPLKNIKSHINNVKILYGGSVNTQNIAEILSITFSDGVLIGGASLRLQDINTMASYL